MQELIKDIKHLDLTLDRKDMNDKVLLKVLSLKAKHNLIKDMIDSIYSFA